MGALLGMLGSAAGAVGGAAAGAGSAIGGAASSAAGGIANAATGIASGAGNAVGAVEGAMGSPGSGGMLDQFMPSLSSNPVDASGKPLTGGQRGFTKTMGVMQDIQNLRSMFSSQKGAKTADELSGGKLDNLVQTNLLGPQATTADLFTSPGIDALQRRTETAQERNRQLKRKKVELGRRQ